MTTEATRIELVTEAIEALVLATVVATLPAAEDRSRKVNHQNVVDARASVAEALRQLVAPVLRSITGGSENRIEYIPAPDARPVYPAA